MPKGQSPRDNLMARADRLQAELERMRSDIPEKAVGATGLVDRGLQYYSNVMREAGLMLKQRQPNYAAIRRRLTKIENGLDANAARLMRGRDDAQI